MFQKYVAIYDYAPRGADELGIKEGETLYFMEEDVNGWIKGKKETTEENGWFPASYVEKVKENKNVKVTIVIKIFSIKVVIFHL